MVDHPEQGMPGVWNKYADYGDDDIWYENSEENYS